MLCKLLLPFCRHPPALLLLLSLSPMVCFFFAGVQLLMNRPEKPIAYCVQFLRANHAELQEPDAALVARKLAEPGSREYMIKARLPWCVCLCGFVGRESVLLIFGFPTVCLYAAQGKVEARFLVRRWMCP